MIDETARKIRDMQTHSSSAVAVAAAEALRELIDREYSSVDQFLRDTEYNSSRLRQANPSHASLQNTQHSLVRRVRDAEPSDLDEARSALSTAIDVAIEEVNQAATGAASNALSLLNDGDVLLTHDFSSTVLSAIEQGHEAGMSFDIYVTEARPRFLGRRMARQVSAIPGMDVTLIIDSAAGHFLQSCDRVLIGMSCIVGEQLYNRVGTFMLCAAAKERGVPVTVVGAQTKITGTGFTFENDFRSSVEVMREPTEAFAIDNPSYDATPLTMVDQIVTDEGITEPTESG